METLKYQIQNCLDQAKRIKEEYPNVEKVEFTIREQSYNDVKAVADEAGKTITFNSETGLILITKGVGFVFVYTKKLVFAERVIVEG